MPLSTISSILLLAFGLEGPWSPDGKQLAYSFIGGPENIYLMDEAGKPVGLVVRDVRDFRPVWAPDGSHVLFTSAIEGGHVVSRIDPDGKNLQALTKPQEAAGDADYMPDGKHIVFATEDPLERNLYIRNLKTGETKALTNTDNFDEMSPRVSPSGEQILFVGAVKPKSENTPEPESDIWILDIKTGALRNLTDSLAEGEFHPSWSNDGKSITYIRVQNGEFDVAIRNIETRQEKIVATGNGYAVLSPAFRKGDKAISFTRTDFAEKGPNMPAIVMVSLIDGRETQLARVPYVNPKQ